ncbi:hypothetical protein M0R89_10800 [Halorussus limi]|uniref:DUF7344 domain-containing protein n=1 Tax=Halorussus limi TaxID=2938695 RepID=A0A8U0HQ72_9EURY|nr:hypothetical protein [Halorussus limi]UPV73038.1 hypothetical protein M0R89_10800 [Halorussus limi]
MDGDPSVFDQQTAEVDLDDLFEVLADGQRRQLLAYLDSTDDDVAAFSELVDHVAEESGAVSNDDDERVAVNLHHNHLPKLEDANVVEYDPRSETVRYRGGPVVSDWVEMARTYESDH